MTLEDKELAGARSRTILGHLSTAKGTGGKRVSRTEVIPLIGKDEAHKIEQLTAAIHADTLARQRWIKDSQAQVRAHLGLSDTWFGRLLGLKPDPKKLNDVIRSVERTLVHHKQSVAIRGGDLNAAITELDQAILVAHLVAEQATTSEARYMAKDRETELENIHIVGTQAHVALKAGAEKNEAIEQTVRTAKENRDAAEALGDLRAVLQSK